MGDDDATAVIVKTRFSLRWRGELPSREWIDERLELLRRVTLPSLRAQTLQDFDWVVLTDPDWEERVIEEFSRLAVPARTTVVPVAFDGRTSRPELREAVRRERRRFLVVRLDSDDALAPDALERMSEAARGLGEEGGLVNLPEGAVLDWASGAIWRRRFRPHYQGPFCALAHSDIDRLFDTGGEHRHAREGRKLVNLDGVAWLQTVHSGNIDNRIVGRTVADRMKGFLKRAMDVVGPGGRVIDDVEPLDQGEAEAILGRFGIDR